MIGSFQCIAHVFGHGPGDHENIGVAWRGDEPDAETLDVVIGVAQRMNLQLAPVA